MLSLWFLCQLVSSILCRCLLLSAPSPRVPLRRPLAPSFASLPRLTWLSAILLLQLSRFAMRCSGQAGTVAPVPVPQKSSRYSPLRQSFRRQGRCALCVASPRVHCSVLRASCFEQRRVCVASRQLRRVLRGARLGRRPTLVWVLCGRNLLLLRGCTA